jgi:radical SAM family uncharacterized protein/radical SAM-linked protein
MSELREKLEREVLPLVTRPSRYIGGERNLPRKDPAQARASFLLAFPDTYEIGMSHVGLRILYDLLNRRPEVVAERTYAPWVDMEGRMREHAVPLFSLETHRPASAFDVIGFSLQYELQYTNVLTMLDLAGVPLRASERGEGDPLVVGGGPCAFNPEPLAAFFDAFVIGDGESAVLDLADLIVEAKASGLSRSELLARAAATPGFYVPSLYEVRERDGLFEGVAPIDGRAPSLVCRRVERALGRESHPASPLVPITQATHDRLAVEIARGCTRGCRFCQAGMVTRPVRNRPVDDVLALVDDGIASSGYDEVSLLSLSASDYPGLSELVSAINDRVFDRRVNISLPSLRADRFGLRLAEEIGRVRRAGLTIAPEAGTQRLRDVVNKNEDERGILESVAVAFGSGWERLKLYFMIGLPTETDEDVEGIVDLVRKVREVGRSHRKGARLNVSVSPFVPKAHTPFQWERQDSIAEIQRKEALIAAGLRMRGVKLALRDPEVSFLEGVMARGGRDLAEPIEAAWRGGARFDGWTETFDFAVWRQALDASGIDPEAALGPLPLDRPLPWDHIAAGPAKPFLIEERERALRAEVTEDCRDAGCLSCGVCAADHGDTRTPPPEGGDRPPPSDRHPHGRRDRRSRRGGARSPARFRVRYAKDPRVRFLSHLDLVRAFTRAAAASGLPLSFTQGFNPHPKIAYGPPLPVGASGEAEFIDLELAREVEPAEVVRRLGRGLPDGVRILSVCAARSRRSAAAEAAAAEYAIRDVPGLAEVPPDDLGRLIGELRSIEEATVPKGDRTRVIRPAREIIEVDVLATTPPAIRVVLAIGDKGSMRPADVVRLLSPQGEAEPALAWIHRTGLFRRPTGRAALERMD